MKPLCFVLMPFGEKPGVGGGVINFDAVYGDLIKPAIEAVGLTPIRADEEETGGIIHKPMFERLILCEFAVADLTTANANVFYELGVRHAVKPSTTILLFAADGARLPFDVAPLRALPYSLGADGKPSAAENDRAALVKRLQEAKKGPVDSPVYQLVEDFPEIDHTKTDVFRERVQYSEAAKEKLRIARKENAAAIKAIEEGLGSLDHVEAGVLVDLLLSYRAQKAWGEMIRIANAMPEPVRKTPLVQEQLAFALNRAGNGAEAEATLVRLIETRGPSSETYGLLGRVYKDRWEAQKDGNEFEAEALLQKAAETYLKGFETDWRDAYPGVNAVTLMTLLQEPDPRAVHLLPVVRYAVERKIAAGKPDYWDYATLLELALLGRDEKGAKAALQKALPIIREKWEPETTLRNLRLIRAAFDARGEAAAWMGKIEEALETRATA